jgi:hypothetical protein
MFLWGQPTSINEQIDRDLYRQINFIKTFFQIIKFSKIHIRVSRDR